MNKRLLTLILTTYFLISNSKGIINEFYFEPSKLIKAPIEIVIQDGNKKQIKIKTKANFVWEVLKERNIKINKMDKIIPSGRNPVTPFLKIIKINRVEVKNKKNYIIEKSQMIFRVKAGKIYKETLIQKGKTGKILEEWELLYVNGKLENKRLKNRKILVKSEPTIIDISSPILKRLNINSATFKTKSSLIMTATAYHPWEGNGVNDTTALGWKTEKGIIAVDPRVIPLKTPLYIPNYGFSIAGDTGGAIKGYKIDLLYPSKREVINFGRRKVVLYILKKIN